MRPVGKRGFVKWPHWAGEDLELRRLSWHEYALLSWLWSAAHPYRGTLRTSWPALATATGLSAGYVERLCRGLRKKGYVWYPAHRGTRRRPIEIALDRFPLAGGGYTDLDPRRGERAADPPAAPQRRFPSKLPLELPAELPSEVSPVSRAATRAWPAHRFEIQEQEQDKDLLSSLQDPVALRALLASQRWWRPPETPETPDTTDTPEG